MAAASPLTTTRPRSAGTGTWSFCELYAGGKYAEGSGNYDFSLGLNGLGLCATQYASEWMTADIYRDGFHYHLDFKKGGNVGGLQKEPFKGKRTGSVIRWKPDTEVFTDIAVPAESFKDMLRRQAVVNDGVTLVFTDKSGSDAEKIRVPVRAWHHRLRQRAGRGQGPDARAFLLRCRRGP